MKARINFTKELSLNDTETEPKSPDNIIISIINTDECYDLDLEKRKNFLQFTPKNASSKFKGADTSIKGNIASA